MVVKLLLFSAECNSQGIHDDVNKCKVIYVWHFYTYNYIITKTHSENTHSLNKVDLEFRLFSGRYTIINLWSLWLKTLKASLDE